MFDGESFVRRLTRHEELNFLLTNRVPRIALTRLEQTCEAKQQRAQFEAMKAESEQALAALAAVHELLGVSP